MTRSVPVRLSAYHRLVIIGTAAAIVFGLGIPFMVVFLNARSDANSQLEVTCSIVQAERAQLAAVFDNRRVLYQIRKELGLPPREFVPLFIPELPPECVPLLRSRSP